MLKIQRRCGYVNWTPQAVKERLELGAAALFVHTDGFVILEKCSEAVSERPYLNVWLAWFKPNRARAVRAQFIAWLDQIGRAIGCEFIEFSSPRDGWVGIEPDFRLHMKIWRRDL